MILKKLKAVIIGTCLAGVFALPLILVNPVHAAVDEASKQAACEGLGAVGADCDVDNTNSSVTTLITSIIEILSWVVGVASVLMIIIGGFRYVISAGNDSSISAAKNTILYAVIGLIITAMAQIIVRFVLKRI